MTDSSLRLYVDGPDAERLAGELSQVIEREFDARPRRELPSPPGAGAARGGDPVALAALVLAIPGAILAAADLAQRIKLREKVDRLIAWAKEKAGAGTPNRVEIIDAEGRAKRLDEAEVAEVIEIAVVLARITRRKER